MFLGLLCGQSLPPSPLPEMRRRKAAIQWPRGLGVPPVGFQGFTFSLFLSFPPFPIILLLICSASRGESGGKLQVREGVVQWGECGDISAVKVTFGEEGGGCSESQQ